MINDEFIISGIGIFGDLIARGSTSNIYDFKIYDNQSEFCSEIDKKKLVKIMLYHDFSTYHDIKNNNYTKLDSNFIANDVFIKNIKNKEFEKEFENENKTNNQGFNIFKGEVLTKMS